ncbi:MAG TPA: hypothetical protein VIF84_03215 [Candidatus Limnocylindrales bacterium]|jgi:hypothetical protein
MTMLADTLDAPVVAAASAIVEPTVRIRLGLGDRPLVTAGVHVRAGDPIAERLRDGGMAETRLGGIQEPEPGMLLEAGAPLGGKRRRVASPGRGRTIYVTPGGTLRSVVGRHQETVGAPAAGVVLDVQATAIVLRTDGIGYAGTLMTGDPTVGRLMVGVARPDDELPVAAIDVTGAGAIVVAGARIDVEALTRARAMGVRGVVVGGVVGRDLRSFAASEARQRAAIHASPAFALLVLDGFGKRPIPPGVWAALIEAEGREVGIAADPAMILLDAATAIAPIGRDRVRAAAGELTGRTGRLIEIVGRRRLPAGVMAVVGRVAFEAGGGQPPEERLVALADLERLAT